MGPFLESVGILGGPDWREGKTIKESVVIYWQLSRFSTFLAWLSSSLAWLSIVLAWLLIVLAWLLILLAWLSIFSSYCSNFLFKDASFGEGSKWQSENMMWFFWSSSTWNELGVPTYQLYQLQQVQRHSTAKRGRSEESVWYTAKLPSTALSKRDRFCTCSHARDTLDWCICFVSRC